MFARFTKPVFPEDTLLTRYWFVDEKQGAKVFRFETLNQNGDKVISAGIAEART
jgi:acyl dehydratase